MLNIDVITLFPDMFKALDFGITGRAIKHNLVQLGLTNPRDFTQDKHRTVDDSPYGGGPGMLLKYQRLKDSIDHVLANKKSLSSKVIYLSPQGKRLQQADIKGLAKLEHIVFLCGRYEGVDERLVENYVDAEFSIGDYVLSGGEIAAMVMIDSVVRLLPNALGDNNSALNDSFYHGLLDFPHYTRPEIVDGISVPDVLLSGDHKKIALWREQQSLKRTFERRPDLLDDLTGDLSDNIVLNKQQTQWLRELRKNK